MKTKLQELREELKRVKEEDRFNNLFGIIKAKIEGYKLGQEEKEKEVLKIINDFCFGDKNTNLEVKRELEKTISQLKEVEDGN